MFKFKVLPIYSIKDGVCSCKAGSACSSPGKHPITFRGSKDATDDPAIIAEWKRRNPCCNWGIATEHDGLAIVDIDPRHDGHLSWVDLITTHNGYPATLIVRTGSGGTHLYYKVPNGAPMLSNSTNRVGTGIDIRGTGGYVVAPPSNHISGDTYTWCEPQLGIVEMPQWLYDLAKKPKEKQRKINAWGMPEYSYANRYVDVISGVYEGGRNAAAASITGTMITRFSKEETWLSLLVWNEKNIPPLAETELRTVFDKINRRERSK